MPTQDPRDKAPGKPHRRQPTAKTTARVAAEASATPLPEDMTADLESQAEDFMADNDVWMYGPNATTVLEMLDRLEEMGPDEARPLALAWQAAAKSGREAARKTIRKLAEEDEEVNRYLGLAREQVGSWVAVKAEYPPYRDAEPDWPRICTQAGEATLDALTSVILGRRLDTEDRAALFEPWLQTIADMPTPEPGAETADDTETSVAEEEEGKYGPNSAAVADFLNRLWLLAPEQVARLVSGWERTPREALDLAHESLLAVVDEDPEWRDQVRLAQEQLVPWLNGGRLEDASGFLGDTGQAAFRKMAGPALADAIAALVVGDLLLAEDAITLYGAWFNLVGAPELTLADDSAEGEDGDGDPA
jgi:hypothetical protein